MSTLLNQNINGYVIQGKIGIGGMAEVWYAENSIGKQAAIKILKPELSLLPDVVARFENEARIMVKINHPNVRQVYDYGSIDNRPCIIMEYLDGADLKLRVTRGERFSDDQLLYWWNQMVDALNSTHQLGIVHRDIKPSNIFITMDGKVKLLDFGISKIRESISLTQTGMHMGTLMYMSPEQVKDSKNLDYRTDYYSLAVSFYHVISGKVPYDATTHSNFDIQEKIVREPLDLSQIPQQWQLFLSGYLNKDANLRPPLIHFPAGGYSTPLETTAEKTQIIPPTTPYVANPNPQPTPQPYYQPPTPAPVPPQPMPQKKKKSKVWIPVSLVVLVGIGLGLYFSGALDSMGMGSKKKKTAKNIDIGDLETPCDHMDAMLLCLKEMQDILDGDSPDDLSGDRKEEYEELDEIGESISNHAEENEVDFEEMENCDSYKEFEKIVNDLAIE